MNEVECSSVSGNIRARSDEYSLDRAITQLQISSELQPLGASYAPHSKPGICSIGRLSGYEIVYSTLTLALHRSDRPEQHIEIDQAEDRTFVNMKLQVRCF
jgi:hypothetical protein